MNKDLIAYCGLTIVSITLSPVLAGIVMTVTGFTYYFFMKQLPEPDLIWFTGALLHYQLCCSYTGEFPLSHPSLDYIRLFMCFILAQGIVKVNLYLVSIPTILLLLAPLKSSAMPFLEIPLLALTTYLNRGSNIEYFTLEGYPTIVYYKRFWILVVGHVILYPVFLLFDQLETLELLRTRFKQLPTSQETKQAAKVDPERFSDGNLLSLNKYPDSPENSVKIDSTYTVLDKIRIPDSLQIESYNI